MSKPRLIEIAWIGGGVAAIALIAAWLLLDRHQYYEYAPASCSAGAQALSLRLEGSTTPEEQLIKRAPYMLVINVDASRTPVSSVIDVVLTPAGSAQSIHASTKQLHGEVFAPGRQVFVTESFDFPYQEVRVDGALRTTPDAEARRFQCVLKPSYREEWSVRFLDALMSV